MKVNSSPTLFFNIKKNPNSTPIHPIVNNATAPISNQKLFAYQDYSTSISFGARLNRTPEDFYSQKFNQENMPDTVKKYLNEDFEERQHMPPSQLQREAFEYMKIADSIEEVKDMYPDEPLFQNLRSFKETKAKRGTLLLLRWDAQTSNTPVFKNKEEKDISLYLLKKVYLEGKTLDEINKDFDKDSTDEIKKELGNKEKNYFSYADLKSMGIKYPNLSYYQSFLATRDDKEYIPASRKSGPRSLSNETIEKMKEVKKSWWAGLNQIERDEQIQKMIEGRKMSDSIYSKYQGQIMTIAAAKLGFSERLSELFADRFNDDEFNEDFETFAEKQRAIMQEFWNKDPKFKTLFSDAILSTIADFEEACNNDNNEMLENLLNKALDLKAKILSKAKTKRHDRIERQKLAPKAPIQQPKKVVEFNINSPKDVLKEYKSLERKSLVIYPDLFAEEFLKYVIDNTDFKTKQQIVALHKENPKELLNISDEELEQIKKELSEKIETSNQDFNYKHTLIAKTNDHIMNTLLYELTGNPKCMMSERGDSSEIIQINNLLAEVLERKAALNKQMKILAKPLSGKDAKDFYDNVFAPKLMELLKDGFKYYPSITDNERKIIKANLTNLFFSDTSSIKKSIDYIGNYNAAIKFIKNKQNDSNARDIVFEHMATDYIFWIFNKKDTKATPLEFKPQKTQNVQTQSSVQAPKDTKTPENAKDIDLSSIDYLKKTFKKVSKKQCEFFADEVKEKLVEFILNHPAIGKEVLTAFTMINSNFIDSIEQISESEKQTLMNVVEQCFIDVNSEFDKKYPVLVQANEFAMNQTIFEITKNPDVFKNTRADSIIFLYNNNLQEKMLHGLFYRTI